VLGVDEGEQGVPQRLPLSDVGGDDLAGGKLRRVDQDERFQ
jgi:hypothetical protein